MKNNNRIEDNKHLLCYFQRTSNIERLALLKKEENYSNLAEKMAYEKITAKRLIEILISKLLRKKSILKQNIISVNNVLEDVSLKDSVCIIAPYHNKDVSDGYLNRIYYVDDVVLKSKVKIYLDYTDLLNNDYSITKIDNLHYVIKFNTFNNEHSKLVHSIINEVKKIYIHSIHMLMPDIANVEFYDFLDNKEIKTVLDLHGTITDELEMIGEFEKAKVADITQGYYLNKIGRIISVTNTMSKYITKKYKLNISKFIEMPITSSNIDVNQEIIKEKTNKTNIIYAGGQQKWQNIDLMNNIISKTLNKYSYKIYVPDSSTLKSEWAKNIDISKIEIDTKNKEELIREYSKCTFGFALREKNNVNLVSCPTKITEYMLYGIIPILKDTNLGDFNSKNIKYIMYSDLLKGKLPKTKEINKMIAFNKKKIISIFNKSKASEKKIYDYLY